MVHFSILSFCRSVGFSYTVKKNECIWGIKWLLGVQFCCTVSSLSWFIGQYYVLLVWSDSKIAQAISQLYLVMYMHLFWRVYVNEAGSPDLQWNGPYVKVKFWRAHIIEARFTWTLPRVVIMHMSKLSYYDWYRIQRCCLNVLYITILRVRNNNKPPFYLKQ